MSHDTRYNVTRNSDVSELTSFDITADDIVREYLQNSGSNDMTVDGSSTPVVFSYTPPANEVFLMTIVQFYMESMTDMSSELFGNLAALTNGITFNINDVLVSTWNDNIDLLLDMPTESNPGEAFGKPKRTLTGTLASTAFVRAVSLPILSIDMIVNDDLSTLDIFRAKVSGIVI